MEKNDFLYRRIKCFNRFLIEEGCFFNYYSLLLKKYASHERIICELQNSYSKDWVADFFIWRKTKEGMEYWSEISDKWEEYVKSV